MTVDGTLTTKKRRFVAALENARTVRDAAKDAGIAERTAWRYLALPAVKAGITTRQDAMTVRELYHPPFSFKPQFKLWLAANDAPQMTDTDTGLWRRLQRVPFEHEVTKRDPKVKHHLCNGAGPAVLAWAVQGCLAWQAAGMAPCEMVQAKTSALRAEFDPLAEFLGERCVIQAGALVEALALRQAYEDWATTMGARPIKDRDWGKRLNALGGERKRLKRAGIKITFWQGIGLQSNDDDEDTLARGHTTPQRDIPKGTFGKSLQENPRVNTFGENASGMSPVCPLDPDNGETEPAGVEIPIFTKGVTPGLGGENV